MEPLAEGKGAWVSVVIPALNEEEPIGDVVRAIPRAVVNEVLERDAIGLNRKGIELSRLRRQEPWGAMVTSR